MKKQYNTNNPSFVKKKAIAIDLDGTLLNHHHSIGQLSLRMIEKVVSRGWLVIIATARPVRAIKLAVPELFDDFYWVACNGAWILKRGEIIRRTEIEPHHTQRLLRRLNESRLRILVEAEDKMFSNHQMPEGFMGQCHALDQLDADSVCKVLVDVDSSDEIEMVETMIPPDCKYVVTDGGRLIQISHKDCDKLDALKFILSQEELSLNETIAFGDDNNDLRMVKAAGCGVAMENATDSLKAVANHITTTNNADGVGRFLEAVLDPE